MRERRGKRREIKGRRAVQVKNIIYNKTKLREMKSENKMKSEDVELNEGKSIKEESLESGRAEVEGCRVNAIEKSYAMD